MLITDIKKSLNKFPLFKSFLRTGLLLMNFKKEKVVLNEQLKLNEVFHTTDSHNFFGYYNLQCINQNDFMLFHSTNSKLIRPGLKDEPSDICIKHTSDKYSKKIGETYAWNWQQGSMMQWIPNRDNVIIFNNYKERYFSEIIDINGSKLSETKFPVYTITKDGLSAYSINFNRLQNFRPDYAYFNKIEKVKKDDEDGIFKIDLKSGEYGLIVPLSRILEINSPKYVRTSHNWVNHLDVNTNGDLMFFHRYLVNDRLYTRLFIYKTEIDEIEFVHESRFISHCTWYDDKILSWSSTNDREEAYNVLHNNGELNNFGQGILNSDGHPTMFYDNRLLLSDTYPDKSRRAELFIFDTCKKEKISIGKFYQPLKYINEFRCDLHPRISKTNKISFDSTHSGKRRLYWVDINVLLEKENKDLLCAELV